MKDTFTFKKHDHIGMAGAEDDHDFLKNCFVDTGDFDVLQNTENSKYILLGRTGSGKTALIRQLQWKQKEKVITINPEDLALTYITNSTILQFFEEIGLNLDPFFKLLWKHVLTVEILINHFNLEQEEKKSLIDILKRTFLGDRKMQQAIEYLEEWGRSFWLETEYRVKEITEKLEQSLNSELQAEIGSGVLDAKLASQMAANLSKEQQASLVYRGRNIIAKTQVQDLSTVMKLLQQVFSNRQKKYYIVIDQLDENWVDEKIRYKLIMALISTASDFRKIRSVKIIIALRRDLLERVFEKTQTSGFQEEKFESRYLPLTWEKEDLLKILDSRINHLIQRQYAKKRTISYKEILPNKFGKLPIDDYLTQVATRPRDIIAFFNVCILVGKGAYKFSDKQLKIAEGKYSQARLRALGDEWGKNYPGIIKFTRLIEQKPTSFKLRKITTSDVENICLNIITENPNNKGTLFDQAKNVAAECTLPAHDFLFEVIHTFYIIGLIGLKLKANDPTSWADERGRGIAKAEINLDASIVIHKTYQRALGTIPPRY